VGTRWPSSSRAARCSSAIHKRLHVSSKDELKPCTAECRVHGLKRRNPIDTKKFGTLRSATTSTAAASTKCGQSAIQHLVAHDAYRPGQGMLSLIASDPLVIREGEAPRPSRDDQGPAYPRRDQYMSKPRTSRWNPSARIQATSRTRRCAPTEQNHERTSRSTSSSWRWPCLPSTRAAADFQMVMAAHLAEHIGCSTAPRSSRSLGRSATSVRSKDPKRTSCPPTSRLHCRRRRGEDQPGRRGQPPGGQPPPNPEAIKAQAKAQESEAATQRKSVASAADEHRKDVQSHAQEKRLDAELRARLMREGLISKPTDISLPAIRTCRRIPRGPRLAARLSGASAPPSGGQMQ